MQRELYTYLTFDQLDRFDRILTDSSGFDQLKVYGLKCVRSANCYLNVRLRNSSTKGNYLGLSLSWLESRDSRAAKLVSQIIAEQVSMNAIDGFVEQGSVDLQ